MVFTPCSWLVSMEWTLCAFTLFLAKNISNYHLTKQESLSLAFLRYRIEQIRLAATLLLRMWQDMCAVGFYPLGYKQYMTL